MDLSTTELMLGTDQHSPNKILNTLQEVKITVALPNMLVHGKIHNCKQGYCLTLGREQLKFEMA